MSPPSMLAEVELADALRAAVGAGHVLTEPDLRAGYERDLTGRFGNTAYAREELVALS